MDPIRQVGGVLGKEWCEKRHGHGVSHGVHFWTWVVPIWWRGKLWVKEKWEIMFEKQLTTGSMPDEECDPFVGNEKPLDDFQTGA